MKTRKSSLLIMSIAAILGLASCGGKDDTSETSDKSSASATSVTSESSEESSNPPKDVYHEVIYERIPGYNTAYGFLKTEIESFKVKADADGNAKIKLKELGKSLLLSVSGYKLYSFDGLELGNYESGEEVTISTDVRVVAQTIGNETTVKFKNGEAAEVELPMTGTFTIPSETPSQYDNEDVFFAGYSVEGDSETNVYRPGETIDLSFYSQEELTLVAHTVDVSEAVHVTDWDGLLYDTSDGSVIVLDNDIDADGADTDTGVAGGEIDELTIIGNGHKISNYTIDVDDSMVNSGLIDQIDVKAEIYDLSIEGVKISAFSSFGASALIGECDGSALFSNVHVSNVSIEEIDYVFWSTHVFKPGQGIVEKDPVSNSISGLAALCGTCSDVTMRNCTVDNFDTTADITTNEVSDSIVIGGLLGSSYGNGDHHSLVIDGCEVKDSNLSADDLSYATIGGLVGSYDDSIDAGMRLTNNKVSNTKITATNCGNDRYAMEIGGVIGSYSGISNQKINEKTVPAVVYGNKVSDDVEIKLDNLDSEKRTSLYAGGFAGEYMSYSYGSDVEEVSALISKNEVNANVSVLSNKAQSFTFVGGFAGDLDGENSNSELSVSNNLVRANLDVKSGGGKLCVGGFFADSYGQSHNACVLSYDSNVVTGDISASDDQGNYGDDYYVSGFGGLFRNADECCYFVNNYVDVASNNEAMNSLLAEFENDAYGDSEYATLDIKDNYSTKDGRFDDELVTVASFVSSEEFFDGTHFDNSIWSFAEGKPAFIA